MNSARVVVVGGTCAGKSSVARHLANAVASPMIELDDLFWQPGWVATADGGFREAVQRLTSGERWVTAGNYRVVHDILWERATLVVWLDMPQLLTLYRGIARTLRRVTMHIAAAPGCYEGWSQFYTRDSVPWVILSQYDARRRILEQRIARHAEQGGSCVTLRSRDAVRRFFAEIGK